MIRAFGAPHRYVQGPGVIDQLEPMALAYGAKRPFIVTDAVVRDLLGERLAGGLGALAGNAVFADFKGECSADEIARLATEAQAAGADLLVGVGGGKAIDTAKGVAMAHPVPVFIVPTIASNDSPTSRVVVVYTAGHVLDEVRRMRANPDLVLVDTEVLVAAPERFFVSGIGDAISKKFEAAQCVATGNQNFYAARPPLLATRIADACYEVILVNWVV
jgi:glycerol dehydrogenase